MTDVKFISHKDEFIKAKDIAVQRALEAIGMAVEGYAKMKTPVGTPESTGIEGYLGGTLRNSISYATKNHNGTTIKVTKEDADPLAENHGGSTREMTNSDDDSVIIGTNVYYAPYVETGTSKTKAQPFLKPAVNNHISEYKKLALNELKKG